MSSPWQVSPALADLLGDEVLAQLDNLDPRSALTCQVCGNVRPAGDPSPMAVIAAATAAETVVIGLAHPACRDRVGDLWPGLVDRVQDPGGLDAIAVFAERTGTAPRAVLAFEPQAFGVGLLDHGDSTDAYVAAHLELGFTLLGEPLLETAPPLASGWLLDSRGGSVTLAHRDLGVAYTQPVTDEVRQWLRMARGEGRCLVVTGTGLNIDPAGPVPVDFRVARLRGRVVAGTVRVR